MAQQSYVAPVLYYRDMPAAARWLCQAFGFEQSQVDKEPGGQVRLISLKLGNAVVLVIPSGGPDDTTYFVQPDAVNGANTQTCYISVEDVDAHCARASRAGAKIEYRADEDHAGDRYYMCRDLEGHLWTFGTSAYGAVEEPRAAAPKTFPIAEPIPQLPDAKPEPVPAAMAAVKIPPSWRPSPTVSIMAGAVFMATGALAAFGSFSYLPDFVKGEPIAASKTAGTVSLAADVSRERSMRLIAESKATDGAAQVARERSQVAELQQNARLLGARLTQLSAARRNAQDALQVSNTRVVQLQGQFEQAKTETEAARQAASVQAGDEATNASLHKTVDDMSAQLAELGSARRQAQDDLKASNGNLQHVQGLYDQAKTEAERAHEQAAAAEQDKQHVQGLYDQAKTEAERAHEQAAAAAQDKQHVQGLYDQAKSEAERAHEQAAAAEQDKQQALSSLAVQVASLGQTSRELGHLQQAKAVAEKAAADTTTQLIAQRALFDDSRGKLDLLNRRLTDELGIKDVLLRRIDDMGEILRSVQRQKNVVEQTAAALRTELAGQVQVSLEAHQQLLSAQNALLSARREIDHLHSEVWKVSLPPAIPIPVKPAAKVEVKPVVKPIAKAVVKPVAQPIVKPNVAFVRTATSVGPETADGSGAQIMLPADVADIATAVLPDTTPVKPSQNKSAEVGKCIGHLLSGKVNYGDGRIWNRGNAFALCRGAKVARDRVDCFESRVQAGETWRTAIDQCKDG
jgi:uncharacterized glyoxalase superfamily protein PhnB